MSNSSRIKPNKPHKDFPLFAHATRRWAKKVRGKLWYFGPWDDPQGALEKWLDEKDDLLVGRMPRARRDANELTLRELVNSFLNTKRSLVDSNELSPRTFADYYDNCEQLINHFGADRFLSDILPDDFESLRAKWAAKWGPVRVGNSINRACVLFNYAFKQGLVDKPMRYGEGFKKPSRRTMRQHRADKGPRMFEQNEIIKILTQAGQPMKSMVLLGINAGLGNMDVARLPLSAIDFDNGWLNFPRPKTGVQRRCKLWGETIAAIREWLDKRPKARNAEHDDLVFLTQRGDSWAKDTRDNPVSKEMRKLLDSLGINGNRNFYALRHTFETIAGDSRDQVAVNAVMGHVDNSMAATYRERISDERLEAVSDFVRRWLFESEVEK